MRTVLNGMPTGGNKGGTTEIISGDSHHNDLACAMPPKSPHSGIDVLWIVRSLMRRRSGLLSGFTIRSFNSILKKGLEIMEQHSRSLAQLGQSSKGDA